MAPRCQAPAGQRLGTSSRTRIIASYPEPLGRFNRRTPSLTSFIQTCSDGLMSRWQRQIWLVTHPSVRSRCLQAGHSHTLRKAYFSRSYGPFILVVPSSELAVAAALRPLQYTPVRSSIARGVAGWPDEQISRPDVVGASPHQPTHAFRRFHETTTSRTRSKPIMKMAASISMWLNQGPSSEWLHE